MPRLFSITTFFLLVGVGIASAQQKHIELKDAKGTYVGMIMFSKARAGGVNVEFDLMGMSPGDHAVILHAVPKCDPPFTSAGPAATDIGNATANARGVARKTFVISGLNMEGDANSILANGGTSLVVYSGAGDMKALAAGTAGTPIACGIITK